MKTVNTLILSLIFFCTGALAAPGDYAGTYSGTMSGDTSGVWMAIVESTGEIKMLSYETIEDEMDGSRGFYVSSTGSVNFITMRNQTVVNATFSPSGSVNGTWSYMGYASGTITGTKQNLTAPFAGTYTGTFTGTDTGSMTFNIDPNGKVTGTGVSASMGSFDSEGAVDNAGRIMFLAMSDTGYGTISGNTVTGTWYEDAEYQGGSFTASKQVPQSAYNYYIPVFKPRPGYWAGLGITNLSSTSTANITATVYKTDGSTLATETKTVAAGCQDSFTIGDSLTNNGWIKVGSDQKLAGLTFLGRFHGTTADYYLADVPFTDEAVKTLLVPHVAQNANWDTTLYIANTENVIGTLTLVYKSKEGIASAPQTVVISPNGSQEISVSTVAGSTDVRGGYVTITSTRDIVAFAIYTNIKTGNYSYAGIAAIDPLKE